MHIYYKFVACSTFCSKKWKVVSKERKHFRLTFTNVTWFSYCCGRRRHCFWCPFFIAPPWTTAVCPLLPFQIQVSQQKMWETKPNLVVGLNYTVNGQTSLRLKYSDNTSTHFWKAEVKLLLQMQGWIQSTTVLQY